LEKDCTLPETQNMETMVPNVKKHSFISFVKELKNRIRLFLYYTLKRGVLLP